MDLTLLSAFSSQRGTSVGKVGGCRLDSHSIISALLTRASQCMWYGKDRVSDADLDWTAAEDAVVW